MSSGGYDMSDYNLPEKFEEYQEGRKNGFLRVKEIKDNGGRLRVHSVPSLHPSFHMLQACTLWASAEPATKPCSMRNATCQKPLLADKIQLRLCRK